MRGRRKKFKSHLKNTRVYTNQAKSLATASIYDQSPLLVSHKQFKRSTEVNLPGTKMSFNYNPMRDIHGVRSVSFSPKKIYRKKRYEGRDKRLNQTINNFKIKKVKKRKSYLFIKEKNEDDQSEEDTGAAILDKSMTSNSKRPFFLSRKRREKIEKKNNDAYDDIVGYFRVDEPSMTQKSLDFEKNFKEKNEKFHEKLENEKSGFGLDLINDDEEEDMEYENKADSKTQKSFTNFVKDINTGGNRLGKLLPKLYSHSEELKLILKGKMKNLDSEKIQTIYNEFKNRYYVNSTKAYYRNMEDRDFKADSIDYFLKKFIKELEENSLNNVLDNKRAGMNAIEDYESNLKHLLKFIEKNLRSEIRTSIGIKYREIFDIYQTRLRDSFEKQIEKVKKEKSDILLGMHELKTKGGSSALLSGIEADSISKRAWIGQEKYLNQ